VYWTSRCGYCENGNVMKVAASGAGPVETVASAQIGVGAVAISDDVVYWLDECNGVIGSCPTSGCDTAQQVVTGAIGLDLVADGDRLWWFRSTTGLSGEVISCPAVGCSAATTVIADAGVSPRNLAVDNVNVYWSAGTTTSTIFTCPKSGCVNGPTTLATNQAQINAVASSGNYLYWTTSTAIMTCSTSGCGSQPTVVAVDPGRPAGITTWQENIYWTSITTPGPYVGSVFECTAPDCSTPFQIASPLDLPLAVLATESGVFWLTRNALMFAAR
jgi:hypothetical protein